MKRKLTSFLLLLALVVAGTSTLVSCKDYDSDVSSDLRNQLADVVTKQKEYIDNLVQKIDDRINTQLQPGGTISNEIVSTATAKAQEEADKAYNKSKTYTDEELAKINAKLTEITNKLGDITKLDSRLTDLSKDVEKNSKALSALTDKAYAMSDSIAHVWALAHADSIRIDALYDSIAKHSTSIDLIKNQINEINNTKLVELKDSVNKHYNDIKDLKGAVANAQSTANAAMDSINKITNTYLATINNEISSLKSDLQNNYYTAAEIRDLYYSKTDMDSKLTALENRITALSNQFNDMINSLVTGIIVQATDNPVLGYANTPADVQLNMLAAYYGYAAKGVSFPNAAEQNYVNSDEYVELPKAEGAITKAAGATLMEGTGNAGTVYMTINSVNNDVDLSGITVTLEASEGTPAPGYAPLTVGKSDRKLTFGYSRAANNGFYAAAATVTDPQAAKFDVDKAALKEAATNVLNKLKAPGKNRLNIADIASTLYKNFNNKLVAYGLKTEWTDAAGKKHATYSKYNLAATAVNPLSYKFLYDNARVQNLSLPRIPQIQDKIEFDDYKFNWTPIEGLEDIKTSITLKDVPDVSTIKINGKITTGDDFVKIIGKENVTGHVNDDGSVTINLDGLGVEVNDIDLGSKAQITYSKSDQTYDITIPMDEFNKVIANINDQVGGQLGKVNDLVDQVKHYSDLIDGKIITRVNAYIQKFENLLRHSNSLLQPMVMYTAANGNWNQLSREKYAPSLMKLNGQSEGAITFVLTSYNAEILAPAYKKFVTVTSAPSAAAKAFANKGVNMNKVIDGNAHKVLFQANEAGVYEITSSSIDYSCYVTTKKYYVKVAK